MHGHADLGELRPPKKVGNKWEYLNTTFWAERGLVRVEHPPSNSYETISLRDWRIRTLAIKAEVDRIGGKIIAEVPSIQQASYKQEWSAKYALLLAMAEVYKEGKRQGDPADPRVLAHYAKHKPYQNKRGVVPEIGNGPLISEPGE